MLTPEQVQRALQDRNLAELARRIGIGYATLYRLRRGQGAKMTWEVMNKVSTYLENCNQ
jgi:DNA-binding Xre family transcriptional regulator